jgi:AcrR family transcriptional regulator
MNQDGTSAKLLAAAKKQFAAHGFEGASVRSITDAAGANLGAITYHFGSKRKLYDHVLESCARPLAEKAVAAAQSEGTSFDRVAAIIRVYFDYLGSDPDVARLMLQELVLGRTPPESAIAPIKEIHGALTQLVLAGQASGEFRPGDARIMAIGIISQPVHLNLVRRALKAVANVDLADATTRSYVVDHVTTFACAGLAAKKSA